MQQHRQQHELLFRDIYPYAHSKTVLPEKSSGAHDTAFNMSIAKKLKEARKAVGYTQADVARRLKISREAVSLWESEGENGTAPGIRKLKDLAELYKISVNDLLGDQTDDSAPLRLSSEEKRVLSIMGSIRKEVRDAWLKMGAYLSGQLPERRKESHSPNCGRRFGERNYTTFHDDDGSERRTN